MKVIGLVGGISWVSTLEYYRLFNEMVNKERGGNESARVLISSVNFGEIASLTHAGRWDEITRIMSGSISSLEKGGAECVLLGANTMHHIADELQAGTPLPLIHVADTVAGAIKTRGLRKAALLGTRYTMQFDFYRNKLAAHGLETLVPEPDEMDFVQDAIYQELGRGIFLPETKAGFLTLMEKMVTRGAEGVILGCTEIPMLIKQEDTDIPVFDSTALHAAAAVRFSLS